MQVKRKRHSSPSMVWKPQGLLQEAVEIQKLQVELMEETLTERPDHPINTRRAFYAPKTDHRFSQALRRRDGTLSIVAAVKRMQPMPVGENPETVAELEDLPVDTRALECNGADAALVYTDGMRYGISLAELPGIAKELKGSTTDFGMPIARHDLIIDPVQIAEAGECGACAVTIVAGAVLPDLLELLNAATAMGMETIVECHTELELDLAMECGATIVFLTNFDRARNQLVPGTAEKLVQDVPPWVLKLGGGGIEDARTCWNYLDAGFNGVVLGRCLLKSRRPSGFMSEIRSQKRVTGDIFSGAFGKPFSEEFEL